MIVPKGYDVSGMVRISVDDGHRYYYSPIREMEQKRDIPFDYLIKNIEFKDGVAKFILVGRYSCGRVFSQNMFDIIQARQEELNKNGYKTFLMESRGYYGMSKTWVVWSKEKTIKDKLKRERNTTVFTYAAIMFPILLVLIFFLI